MTTLNSIDKTKLIADVTAHLSTKLDDALIAANNAHLAAIDEQSKPETQYDTLAIEAAYLAEGQSKRIEELKLQIVLFKELSIKAFNENDKVGLTALVQLAKDETHEINNTWYFLVPTAGGFSTKIQENQQTITVLFITPQSPIGQAILGKTVDDDISLTIKNKVLTTYISHLL